MKGYSYGQFLSSSTVGLLGLENYMQAGLERVQGRPHWTK